MAQRPVSLGGKAFCRDASLLEDHAAALYGGRPTLYSVRNNDRLYLESTRARRIITNSTPPRPRDFTAYFHSYPNSDPSYAASHTSPEPVAQRKVISMYPMSQSLRWHPYVETSSIENLSCRERESSHNCRCTSCISKSCASKVSSSSTSRSNSNRNNIMTFADIYTMTPMVTDTACGSSMLCSTRVSQVSETGSDMAERESQASTNIEQVRTPPVCHPIPILKKKRRLCNYNDFNQNDSYYSEQYEPPQRCSTPEREEPSRGSSIKSFFRCRRKKKEQIYENNTRNPPTNGKLIYNEGISDRAKDRCPLIPTLDPSVEDVRECDRSSSVKSRLALRYDDEQTQIPHSHRYNMSRYHKNCKHSRSKVYMFDEDVACRIVPTSPRLHSKRVVYKPVNFYKCSSIKLPRKVLTSDVNIDEYVDMRYPKPVPPTAARRR